jgi:hypothetical protein
MSSKTPLRLCFAVLIGLFAVPISANTLSNVLVEKANGRVTVDVRLACSFRYDHHEPRGMTREVVIDLVPVGACQGFNLNQPLLEMQRPSGSELAALSEVEFDVRSGRVSLIARFTESKLLTVSQPDGLRSVQLSFADNGGVKPAFIGAADREGERSVSLPVLKPPASRAAAPRQPVTSSGSTESMVDGAFAINMLTTKDLSTLVANDAGLADKQLYTSLQEIGGVKWQHLRLGFFASEGRAEAALTKVQTTYPEALVIRVDATEFQVAAANPYVQDRSGEQAIVPVPIAATGLSDGRLAELMAQAQEAMLGANYPAAIQMYTKVLREGDTRYAPDALEYLALARERNGQEAHAVAEYRRYLARYPANEGAMRVQQRLDGLVLAGPDESASSTANMPMVGNKSESSRWDVYGGIAQYYRRDVNDYNDEGAQTAQSAILSDMDLIARRGGERFDLASRMTLSNYYDLLSGEQEVGSDTRFYYLYADVADRDLGLSARVGRQTLHTSGVLGRFDGAHLAWQFSPDWRVNLISGEPVYSTSRQTDADRQFYAVSVDAFDIADLFDLSFYYNTQDVDGIDDRDAIGTELRYYGDNLSLVSYLDYDIGYNVLNNFIALGNYTFDNRLTLNATLDYRRSPYLLTENALAGQEVGTIDELLNLFSEDEIRAQAEDRSGELTTVTIGFSRPLYERFQINADVTVSDYTGAPAFGDLAEIDADYYYNLSLVGSSLMKEGDTSIFTLRYLDGGTASTTSFALDTRYPLNDRLRINPRVLLAYRDFTTTNATELLAVPALRLFYRFRRRTRFEFEAGARWSDREVEANSVGATSWFLYTGYRTDF